MATAKKRKGIVDQAIESKPVVKTKNLISKVVGAATDAFMNPPLALDLPKGRKSVRRASAKSASEAGAKKTSTKSMDRKLVSAMEDYEVKYLAQKHKVTQKAVKEAVAKVGSSRNKVEAALKAKRA